MMQDAEAVKTPSFTEGGRYSLEEAIFAQDHESATIGTHSAHGVAAEGEISKFDFA